MFFNFWACFYCRCIFLSPRVLCHPVFVSFTGSQCCCSVIFCPLLLATYLKVKLCPVAAYHCIIIVSSLHSVLKYDWYSCIVNRLKYLFGAYYCIIIVSALTYNLHIVQLSIVKGLKNIIYIKYIFAAYHYIISYHCVKV